MTATHDDPTRPPGERRTVTRRELLRSAGIGAAAVPLAGIAGCTDAGAAGDDATDVAAADVTPTEASDAATAPTTSSTQVPEPTATATADGSTPPAVSREFMRHAPVRLPREGAGNGMNVIIVILDSLRRDHVGAYGNGRIHTPSIDELARSSTRFTEARPEAMPTMQVRRCVHTGERTFPMRRWYPRKGDSVRMPGWEPIPEEQVTLSEMLSAAGYYTALVTDTPHLFKPSMNFHRGFDTWSFVRGQQGDRFRPARGSSDPDLQRYLSALPPGSSRSEALEQYAAGAGERAREQDYQAPKVFREATSWLRDAVRQQPFLMVVDSYDPHEPWDPPASYIRRYDDPDFRGPEPVAPAYGSADYLTPRLRRRMQALYSAEVTLADAWLGRFLDAVDRRGLLDNSLVVFLSDHGVLLGEHGLVGKPVVSSLWPEITDIPLLMRHPERRRSRVDDRLVSTHDIVPTILATLGIPPSRPLDGIDLSPVLAGNGDRVRRRGHLTMGYGPNAQVRRGRWALTTTADGSSRQLYDVRADPGFTTDVSGRHRDVVRELVDLIEHDAGGPLPVHDTEAVAARLGTRS